MRDPHISRERRAKLRQQIAFNGGLRAELEQRMRNILNAESIMAGYEMTEKDDSTLHQHAILAVTCLFELLSEAECLIVPKEYMNKRKQQDEDEDWDE